MDQKTVVVGNTHPLCQPQRYSDSLRWRFLDAIVMPCHIGYEQRSQYATDIEFNMLRVS